MSMTNKETATIARQLKAKMKSGLPITTQDLLGNADHEFTFLWQLYWTGREPHYFNKGVQRFEVESVDCGGWSKPTFVAVMNDGTRDRFSVTERLSRRVPKK